MTDNKTPTSHSPISYASVLVVRHGYRDVSSSVTTDNQNLMDNQATELKMMGLDLQGKMS